METEKVVLIENDIESAMEENTAEMQTKELALRYHREIMEIRSNVLKLTILNEQEQIKRSEKKRVKQSQLTRPLQVGDIVFLFKPPPKDGKFRAEKKENLSPHTNLPGIVTRVHNPYRLQSENANLNCNNKQNYRDIDLVDVYTFYGYLENIECDNEFLDIFPLGDNEEDRKLKHQLEALTRIDTIFVDLIQGLDVLFQKHQDSYGANLEQSKTLSQSSNNSRTRSNNKKTKNNSDIQNKTTEINNNKRPKK